MSLDNERAAISAQLDYIGQRLVDREEMTKVMTEAVTAGIRAAVSDPETWAAISAAVQQQAAQATGGWLLGSIRAAISKAGLVILLGIGIYMVGGWTALLAALKTLTGATHP